jgi:hypothetical protein
MQFAIRGIVLQALSADDGILEPIGELHQPRAFSFESESNAGRRLEARRYSRLGKLLGGFQNSASCAGNIPCTRESTDQRHEEQVTRRSKQFGVSARGWWRSQQRAF